MTAQVEEENYANREEDIEDKEEQLLRAARCGDATAMENLLNENPNLNLNCKGKKKRNLHWTPLHLSSYFGHVETTRVLLDRGANASEQNAEGDTPLHKAALTNRERLVMLLLLKGADVFLTNQEGQTARTTASEMYIKNIIMAAELAEKERRRENFFQAVKDGDWNLLQKMLRDSRPGGLLDVNSVDIVGNAALHIAAHRDQRTIAILLLQCGADPNLKNRRSQSPADLAKSEEMAIILKVAPLKEIKEKVSRFQGPLVRGKRIMGKQVVWAVLDRGVLSFFRNPVDASTGSKRKHFRHLGRATVLTSDGGGLDIVFPGGSRENLWAPTELDRNRWLKSLEDHIEFGSREADKSQSEEGQTFTLGGLEDALLTAEAQHERLCNEVAEVGKLHTSYLSASLECGDYSVKAQNVSQNLRSQLEQVTLTSETTIHSLKSCLVLMKQLKESLSLMREKEVRKNQLLEKTLEALALKTKDHPVVKPPVIETLSESDDSKRFVDALPDTSQNHESRDESWESAVR